MAIGDDVQAIMTIFSGPAGKHITSAWASLNLTQYLAGINVEAQSSTHFAETEGAAYGEIAIETLPPDVESTTKTAAFRTAYEAEYDEAGGRVSRVPDSAQGQADGPRGRDHRRRQGDRGREDRSVQGKRRTGTDHLRSQPRLLRRLDRGA